MAEPSEEARAALQRRLTLLYKLMFWCFVALIAFLWVLYTAYPSLTPRYNDFVYVAFAVGLSIMTGIWRGALVGHALSLAMLHALDACFVVGANTLIAACAVIAYDFHPSGYTCLMYASFSVLARSLIVPSTGARTTVLTALAFVPMTIAAIVLPVLSRQEVPAPMFVVIYVQIVVVAVLLAAAGSRIIYGLRREVRDAKQLGQYTLVGKIGGGGMGEVFLAHHERLRRPTAIKRLLPDRISPEHVERFEREVRATSELTHPNTVVVYDYGHTIDGVFYYAMEYLDGIDLGRLVRDHGPQPAGRVAHVLAQVCGSLQEAHARELIHRDIKPANIILCERGGVPDVAKVVDFGLVKELTAETGASTQILLGTPGYIAPELMTDPGSIGPAVDLYAVGAVGYFLLTARRVFPGKTAVDECTQHITRTPEPPSALAPVPPALEAIILRCLAKQPRDRYASAGELGAALAALGPLADWDEPRAEAWWRAHAPRRGSLPEATGHTATQTITVALGDREAQP